MDSGVPSSPQRDRTYPHITDWSTNCELDQFTAHVIVASRRLLTGLTSVMAAPYELPACQCVDMEETRLKEGFAFKARREVEDRDTKAR